jgi:hypothetical protein
MGVARGTAWAVALFELADAVLCADAPDAPTWSSCPRTTSAAIPRQFSMSLRATFIGIDEATPRHEGGRSTRRVLDRLLSRSSRTVRSSAGPRL